MVRIMRLLLLLILMPTASHAVTGSTLTVDFEDTPLGDIFYQLAEFQQMNLVMSSGVSGNLSLRLQDISWPQAIELISEMTGVRTEISGNILRVFPKEITDSPSGALMPLPLQSRRFILRHTLFSELQPLLSANGAGILSPQGRLTGSKGNNVLIVRDTPQALEAVADWLTLVDIPVPQVEITAHIITISEESLRELGVEWGLSGQSAAGRLAVDGLSIPLGVEPADFSAGVTLRRVNGQLLSLELSALEQENQVEIIASPRLITSQGSMASIKQGTEIPYLVMQKQSDTATVEFKEAVLGMEITPEVFGDQEIRLTIHLSQNMPGKVLQQGKNMPLSIDKQEMTTRVILRDGQTLALGGIFQQHQNNQQNKVPLFGDIPGIGRLFRRDSQQQNKRELVIFITPRLIFS